MQRGVNARGAPRPTRVRLSAARGPSSASEEPYQLGAGGMAMPSSTSDRGAIDLIMIRHPQGPAPYATALAEIMPAPSSPP